MNWDGDSDHAMRAGRQRVTYDDHDYCELCGQHSPGCYCFDYRGPEADDMFRVCPGHPEWLTREWLGEQVRIAWVLWAEGQPDPKPAWLVPWKDLGPADREADMSIGVRLFGIGFRQAREQGGSS